MTDLIAFVDAISTSPAVRLDLNDDAGPWHCSLFSAPPPRLRRAMSSNAMTDGGQVSSSSYDMRGLTISLDLITADQDANALEFQKLARELNRPTNILKYQPVGASKPVFFKTFRSDMAQLADVIAKKAMRQLTIELLAEPFALGLDETFTGTFGVDASSGTSFEATAPTILGDVSAPLVLDFSSYGAQFAFGQSLLTGQATPLGVTAPVLVRAGTNASLGTLGTDASAVTGAGTSYANADYINISFATATAMTDRLVATAALAAGTYRVLARIGSSTTTSVFRFRAQHSDSIGALNLQTGPTLTFDTTINGSFATFFDLGLFRFPFATDNVGTSVGYTVPASYWTLQAARDSGTGALRIDSLLWVPTIMDDTVDGTAAYLYHGANGLTTIITDRWDTSTGTAIKLHSATEVVESVSPQKVTSGSLPSVHPGCTNHLRLIPNSDAAAVSQTVTFAASYRPRYLFVRPVSS